MRPENYYKSIDKVMWLIKHDFVFPWNNHNVTYTLTNLATTRKNVIIYNFLRKHNKISDATVQIAIVNSISSYWKNVGLWYLDTLNYPLSSDLYRHGIYTGQVNVLKILDDRGCPFEDINNLDMELILLEQKLIGVIEYLLKTKKYEFSQFTITKLIKDRNFKVIQIFRSNDVEIHSEHLRCLMLSECVDVLQWAYGNDIVFDELFKDDFVKYGKPSTVEYFTNPRPEGWCNIC